MSETTALQDPAGSPWPSAPDRQLLLFQALHPADAAAFLALVSAILPHRNPDLVAARLATALMLDAQMVTNLGLRSTTLDGLRDLDQRARTEHNQGFTDLPDDDRAAILRSVESTEFFQSTLHQVKYDFYNRHIVWDVLGYPDLSNDAGYLDRDFDRLET